MKVMVSNRAEVTEASAADFIHGKEYVHRTGERITFDDMAWLISSERGKRFTVYFEDLPEYLARAAKLSVARGWLAEGKSLSWIASSMVAFRHLGEWLNGFEGTSLSDLTDDHAMLLQSRLAKELTHYNDTLEAASLQLGRPLRFRESKQICAKSKLLGPKSIRNIVSTFNMSARAVEGIDSFIACIRLYLPRGVSSADANRGIGSADSYKVLTPQQIAELEWALGQDLRRYKKARDIIEKELSRVDLNILERKKPNPVHNLELYLGLNGLREHTAPEIAELRGLSPSGYGNVPRLIRSFLAKRIGEDLAAEVMKLRSQFHPLREQKRFAEVEAAKERILSILADADLSFQEPKAFCIEMYFGIHGQRVHSLSAIAKQLGVTTERSALHHIHEGLFSLIGNIRGKRLLAIRERLLYYLTRAIKAQALRLQIGAARRISAILESPIQPEMKVQEVEGRRIVEIHFRSGKTWGDEGMKEWVPCVDYFGNIAEDAIRTTQALTRELRQVAPEEFREHLFLIPDNSFEAVTLLSTKVLQEYIYTNQKGKDTGILRRYSLEGLIDFEAHHIRHTNTTHMIEEGGTIYDVAQYLGHNTTGGATNMAAIFYLSGGTETQRRQAADALRRGAATGLQFDGVARLKIEAMGEDAKKVPVLPNELTFEEARRRVLEGDIIDEVPMDADEAVRLLNQKVVFNVNSWGGCLLQVTSGHCPTANPCPIGILQIGEQPRSGCGCKYLVLMPHSVEQLSADIAIMEAQLAKMTDKKWAGFRSHIEAKKNHWQSLLEVARSLSEPE